MIRFDVESWIWYTFAVGVLVSRLLSRTILFGSVQRLQYDDWIMGLFVMASYTTLIIMANQEAKSHSNLLPPGFPVDTLTSEDISKRQYGSKIVIVVEQMQIAVIWGCKTCLLILYYRLTRMVAGKENLAIKLLAVYVAFGFLVMEVLYFAVWCRPFHNYWAVPTSNSQCDALIDHRITNAVFNISSDLAMLFIALPMFIRSFLPLKRKLILCCIFSLGIFVIVAAVLNKYYSFATPYQSTWIFWYIRESSTAIIVANLPFTWTLLRKLFKLGAFDESSPPPPSYHSARTAGGRRTHRKRASGQTTHGSSNGTARSRQGGIGTSESTGSSGSKATTSSATGTILGSPSSNAPLISPPSVLEAPSRSPDVDIERGASPEMEQRNTESWDAAARHVLLAEPRQTHTSPPKAEGSASALQKRILASAGGGGGGRSARDRKMKAKIAQKK